MADRGDRGGCGGYGRGDYGGRGGEHKGGGGGGRGGYPRGDGGPRGNNGCHICGEKDHFVRDCPQNTAGGGGGRGRGRGRGDGSYGGPGGPGREPYEDKNKVYGNGPVPSPDSDITKLEDAMVKLPLDDRKIEKAQNTLNEDIPLPPRPGYGTMGTNVILRTNYFTLSSTKDIAFYRYSIAIDFKYSQDEKAKKKKNGEEDDDGIAKPKKKRVIQQLLQQDPFIGVIAGSDWSQVLVTAQKVQLKSKGGKNRQSFDIEWYPADGKPPAPFSEGNSKSRELAHKRNTYKLNIEELGTVSVKELMLDISGRGKTYSLKPETIGALNVMLAYGPSTDLNIAVVGNNRFYPMPGHPQCVFAALGNGLQAHRGYFSSVRTSVNRVILNVNVATGTFYQPGPLPNLITSFLGQYYDESDKKHAELVKFLRKVRVETNYLLDLDKAGKSRKGNDGKLLTKRQVRTIYSISKFGSDWTKIEFTRKTKDAKGVEKEQTVTVAEHFKQMYPHANLNLKSKWVVDCGDEEQVNWIPGDLCTVLPGQACKRTLSGEQTSNMIQFAARSPSKNATSIMDHGLHVAKILPIDNGVNTHLQNFCLKVEPNLLTVHGRVLLPPQLTYNNRTMQASNGFWNLAGKSFFKGQSLPSWNVLVIHLPNNRVNQDECNHTIQAFEKALRTCGIAPGPTPRPMAMMLEPQLLRPNADREEAIRKIQIHIDSFVFNKASKWKPKFLFVLLPNENAMVYDCVKFVCDVVRGIPNVCNIWSKFKKSQPQYFGNVALKFNHKLGGINHCLSADQYRPLDSGTIVFGIDVTHPSPGSASKAPSVAGIVASVDNMFSQYPGSLRCQVNDKKNKQSLEMVKELKDMIKERLVLWQKRNGRLPTKAVVYRDGVSEGQYQIVLKEEYSCFVKAFNELYGKTKNHPKVSIIVVGKGHHTRFFPTDGDGTDGRTGNPKPGTVVDRGVTGEKIFDFFLQAHQGLQGTAKPAHYVVLKDDIGFGADQLQKLTHNLCYTFAKATRAVSLCPPAYYADLICERGRSYLQTVLKGNNTVKYDSKKAWTGQIHEDVRDTMFYL